MTHVRSVLTEHGGVASCIVDVSAASKNQEAKEKPPLHGDPTPRMKDFPPLHGDPTPRMKHFPPLHGMDRAIMKFSSPTHTQNAQFPTIFTVLGRYFFHRGTPHDHTVQRRGDLSFIHPLEAPPVRRTSKEPSAQSRHTQEQQATRRAASGSRAPSGSPIRRRHPPGRAGAPTRRPRARDPRPRQ